MYPLVSNGGKSTPDRVCYSFAYRPNVARPKFLARTARILGCVPDKHYRKLIEGHTIVTDDGKEVTPEMVMGEASDA